jgi:hypothetical protein
MNLGAKYAYITARALKNICGWISKTCPKKSIYRSIPLRQLGDQRTDAERL